MGRFLISEVLALQNRQCTHCTVGGGAGDLSNAVRFRGSISCRRFHLTERIYELVLESQLPHKIVNLLFTITNQNNELTVL